MGDEARARARRMNAFLTSILVVLVVGSMVFMGYVISLAEFRPYVHPRGSVLLEVVNNTTRLTSEDDEEAGFLDTETTPAELRMKLLAVYLANDVEPELLRPMYGSQVASQDLDGNLTQAMNERRIYTNAECDPDGDGFIDDCDITGGWKFPNQVRGWLDLVDNTAAIARLLYPFRHFVAPGAYRHVVVQTCLQNLDNGTYFAFRGGTMEQEAYFSVPACFHLTSPLPEPVTIRDGDEVTVTLAYKLDGVLQTVPKGDVSLLTGEWTCAVSDADVNAVCVRIPAFTPTARRAISFPTRQDNASAAVAGTGAEEEEDGLSAGEAESERFDRECAVKWRVGMRAERTCIWPPREWRAPEMAILLVVMSVFGVIGVILKSTLEHLWQTGTAPSIGWALHGHSITPAASSALKGKGGPKGKAGGGAKDLTHFRI